MQVCSVWRLMRVYKNDIPRLAIIARYGKGHPIMKFHCIIHPRKPQSSDAYVSKIVNFLVGRSVLTHRQLQTLLDEIVRRTRTYLFTAMLDA